MLNIISYIIFYNFMTLTYFLFIEGTLIYVCINNILIAIQPDKQIILNSERESRK